MNMIREPFKWLYRWFGLTRAQKRKLKRLWKEWGITLPQMGMLVSALLCMLVLPLIFSVLLATFGF